MIDFFRNNLDSFIISTIFLLLGFIPTLVDYIKTKEGNNTIYSNHMNANSNNVANSYNHSENNYNTKNIVIYNNSNPSPASGADDPWYMIILVFVFIFIMILFYKYIDKLLITLIIFTLLNLILSILISSTIYKINKYAYLSSNIINISIRNIICYLLLSLNYIIIFYKVNFSSSMTNIVTLIRNLNFPISSNALLEVYRFLLDNVYETFTGSFIIFGFFMSIYLIYRLFISYVFITSSIRFFLYPHKRISSKLYNILNQRESIINQNWWICAFIILFILSTGTLAYIFNLFIRLSQHHIV